MRDPEQEYPVYPKHQPDRSEQNHHDSFAIQDEGMLEDEPRRHRPLHQRDTASSPQLPPGHARKAIIIGAVAGILASLQGLIITLANAQYYTKANKYINDVTQMPSGVAFTLFGLLILGIAISAVIYFIGGLVIGRVAVHRRWCFIGGFIGGVVSTIIGDIIKQIPSYPNASNTGFTGGLLGAGGGFAALLIGLILLGVLAGALSWLGAWLATRRHPYYV